MLIFLFLAASLMGADGPTLADLLGSAFPSELTASGAGAKVAFVMNARGVRNIYVAEPPSYKARAVTHYTADDGQEITNLEWSPDARTIVYVRGGAANRAGEIPNPLSEAKSPEQAIWAATPVSGQSRRLAAGGAPAMSPKTSTVAFLVKGQVWLTGLDGKAEQAFQMRGTAGNLAWSPDGAFLAFTSNRGDHSFVGVFDVAKKAVRFVDPGLDQDVAPVWSPAGRRLAFVRRAASRGQTIFGPQRAAEPWSIRIHDLASGVTREAWKADAGAGSVFASHALPAAGQLLWGDADRILFSWEKTGWNHLYSLPANGGLPVALTKGAFEVETATLSPDRKHVVYASNQGDAHRRHLWRVPVEGGAAEALTKSQGIEWSGVYASDGKAFAYLASDAKQSATPMIASGAGAAQPLLSLPPAFDANALVEPKAVTFAATDGMEIPAQLFLPAGLKAGEKRPAAIFFHGGSRRQMLLGWHYASYYHNCYALTQYLVSRGWVALSVNYRSGIGYGMEFREALEYGATGASEVRDVIGAGLYLRGLDFVDGRKIAAWGGSYGGYLTAHALSRAPELFAAGVDVHGVHDWNVTIRNFVPGYNPVAEPEAARLAFTSSPMAAVRNWRSPVLLIHGDDDRNVPFSESVTLVEELRRNKVAVESVVFPDEVHSFLRYASWVKAWEAAAEFLERRLRSGK
ncbi:MAG: S9 family peptidase [Acidobacteria bacterium]|nr:S9 family peptidase [Acidobacteriota bacterium]